MLALGTASVATLNPSSSDATNQWPWSDVVSVSPVQGTNNEFSVTFRKGKKTDTFRFSTDHRAEVVTHALRRHEEFADKTFGAGKVSLILYHIYIFGTHSIVYKGQRENLSRGVP